MAQTGIPDDPFRPRDEEARIESARKSGRALTGSDFRQPRSRQALRNLLRGDRERATAKERTRAQEADFERLRRGYYRKRRNGRNRSRKR